MARVIIAGEPGEVYTNTSGKVAYQFLCDWSNTCGQCAQYDHQVGPTWPIPLHRGCKCKQIAIWPGDTSRPFADFREKIASLPDDQKAKVVGVASLKLIESGTVKWEDVVTGQRVRDLQEVVATKKLSIDAMTAAGVSKATARQAFEAVHTPAHELAARKRADLLRKILDKGTRKDALRAALAEKLAARVGIASGPSGPSGGPAVPTKPSPTATRPTTPLPVPLGVRARADYLKKAGVKPEVAARLAGQEPGRDAGKGAAAGSIAERLANYTEGDRKVAGLAALGQELGRLMALKDAKAAERARLEALFAASGHDPNWEGIVRLREVTRLDADLRRAVEAESRRARADAQAILRASDPATVRFIQGEFKDGRAKFQALAGADLAANREAERWLGSVLADAGHGRPLGTRVGAIGKGREQRSYHIADVEEAGDFVAIARGDGAGAHVHEFGHNLESRLTARGGTVLARSHEFLAHRVGDEAPTRISDAMGPGFAADEVGRKDRFGDAFGGQAIYVGKQYPGGAATEVLAMGLEKMYEDPVGFALRDPEYAKFVLGILDGGLR